MYEVIACQFYLFLMDLLLVIAQNVPTVVFRAIFYVLHLHVVVGVSCYTGV